MSDGYEDHKDYMRTGGLLRDALASVISMKQNFCTPAELAEEVLQAIGDTGYVVVHRVKAGATEGSNTAVTPPCICDNYYHHSVTCLEGQVRALLAQIDVVAEQGQQPSGDSVTPEMRAAIAACPEPFWHETHRYCPVCPWNEQLAL